MIEHKIRERCIDICDEQKEISDYFDLFIEQHTQERILLKLQFSRFDKIIIEALEKAKKEVDNLSPKEIYSPEFKGVSRLNLIEDIRGWGRAVIKEEREKFKKAIYAKYFLGQELKKR